MWINNSILTVIERETDRQTDRDRETDRETKRQRETERQRGGRVTKVKSYYLITLLTRDEIIGWHLKKSRKQKQNLK